ncbi:MAG: HEAT repeat domain-containing protein [Planctomycetes bacterium]|nr:HEAT repeat domain-containing protein [Planctomycetota bacterium]
MLKAKTVIIILLTGLFITSTGFARSLGDDWNDFLHYTKIGRLDMAKGYAQAVIDSNPNPVELLALSEKNPAGLAILIKATEGSTDAEMVELSGKILDIIEQGRFIRRADAKIIVEEISRLSSTARGRLAAIKRLKNAGEYAIPYMLNAMADKARKEELPNILWALPQISKNAIRPLTTALQTENMAVKIEIVKALGEIGYPQSLAWLKYVEEKTTSNELRKQAIRNIKKINPAALEITAAQLFYQLADDYYYHAESLAPAEDADFANVWFWNSNDHRLTREKTNKDYFNELMAMRCCEMALKADAGFSPAIGLWLASYFKAESAGVDMPDYFGSGHADAMVYATTAGPEYLHQALAKAIKDKNAYIALGVVEALASSAGEKSLFARVGIEQPLTDAISFNDKAVSYSAAIAIATAGPKENFAERNLVIENLAKALAETEQTNPQNNWVAENYATRSAKAMLKLAQTKNTVIDLSKAQAALIDATRDSRDKIKILTCDILAYLKSSNAQQAIAKMALTENNTTNIRILAFDALAVSAKLNANQLSNEQIDAVYSIVASEQAETQLRSAAAAAYGALNLPSQKVKNLILDQAKI